MDIYGEFVYAINKNKIPNSKNSSCIQASLGGSWGSPERIILSEGSIFSPSCLHVRVFQQSTELQWVWKHTNMTRYFSQKLVINWYHIVDLQTCCYISGQWPHSLTVNFYTASTDFNKDYCRLVFLKVNWAIFSLRSYSFMTDIRQLAPPKCHNYIGFWKLLVVLELIDKKNACDPFCY